MELCVEGKFKLSADGHSLVVETLGQLRVLVPCGQQADQRQAGPAATVEDVVLDFATKVGREFTIGEAVAATGLKYNSVAAALYRLVKEGRLERVSPGVYRLRARPSP